MNTIRQRMVPGVMLLIVTGGGAPSAPSKR
jgi:hypothetical protein